MKTFGKNSRKNSEKFQVKNRTLAKTARMRHPGSKARETQMQRRQKTLTSEAREDSFSAENRTLNARG
jgi:hypothetical protein